jgi:cytochrome c553
MKVYTSETKRTCTLCGSRRTYLRFRDEANDKICAICGRCHEEYLRNANHRIKPRPQGMLKRLFQSLKN